MKQLVVTVRKLSRKKAFCKSFLEALVRPLKPVILVSPLHKKQLEKKEIKSKSRIKHENLIN